MLGTVVPGLIKVPSAEHFRPLINPKASSQQLDSLDKLADKRIKENEQSISMEGYPTPEDRQDAWHTNKHLTNLERQRRALMEPEKDLIDFSAQKQK